MKGLEELKQILRDDSLHLYMALVETLHMAEDRSYLKVRCLVLPELRPIIATMSWENVGPSSGDFEFPVKNDLVLIANVEGDDDQAYIIRRMTSREDKIPANAENSKIQKARSGNRFWNISDTKILLSRTENAEPDENLVLGQVFKLFAQTLLNELKDHADHDAKHKHMGNLGYLTSVPDLATDFNARKTGYTNLKASPVDDEAILSDLSYTEK